MSENEQQQVDGTTRVQLTYSVALQDVPKEVHCLMESVAKECEVIAMSLRESTSSLLEQKQSLGAVLQASSAARNKLQDLHHRLEDYDSILYGYYKAVTEPPPVLSPVIEETISKNTSELPAIEPNISLTEIDNTIDIFDSGESS